MESSPRKGNASGVRADVGPRVCFGCGAAGHIRPQCPRLPGNRAVTGRPVAQVAAVVRDWPVGPAVRAVERVAGGPQLAQIEAAVQRMTGTGQAANMITGTVLFHTYNSVVEYILW